MTGWKTWTGAALIAIGTLLTTMPALFEAQKEVGEALIGFGVAIGSIGIGHKIEKAKS